ncbi:hypothetical protein [Biostraticola tofi]|uniref:CdiI C-terminal domain-containing protein n=1 Tax=Biostraticola tofi TaxID=466109 RepID=A0A4R3YFF6_9GAMM|nr:hypothetical protein [Biostraticola tofi]TCV90927.1 hypothetical protein EDC52_1312 [Biostraticola tofi]
MFGIFPEKHAIQIENEIFLPASIIIDDFQESMNIPLTYWNIVDYKKSWLRSLKEGLEKRNHAALAVSMYDPNLVNFVFVWVIYFESEIACVQNSIIFLEEYNDFNPNKLNEYIDTRTTHDEDGMKISEWSTDFSSVVNFYNSLND